MPEAINRLIHGVTGHRTVTPETLQIIREWVQSLPDVSTVYHGACVGTDAAVAKEAWERGHRVVAVIPDDRGLVSIDACLAWSNFIIYAPAASNKSSSYRARNELLVRQLYRQGGTLKAFWNGDTRSGTSMTINIAKQTHVPVEIERV